LTGQVKGEKEGTQHSVKRKACGWSQFAERTSWCMLG